MNTLALFNVDFCSWPLMIFDEIGKQNKKLNIIGAANNDPAVTKYITDKKLSNISFIHCLSKLENDWLKTPNASQKLQYFEKILGTKAISKIATSDRELSFGWVSGGTHAKTPLRHLVKENSVWQAYLAGLISFFYDLFEKNEFDFILCYSVQDAASVTCAILAEHFNVKFLSPKAIGFKAKTCFFDDVKTMSPCFRHLFEKAKNEPDVIAPEIYDEAEKILNDFRASPKAPSYMDVANKTAYERPKLLDSAALIYRILRRRKPISLRYPYPFSLLKWEYTRWIKSYFDRSNSSFISANELKTPYAYFPLHYEPEASMLVSAPEHTNQIAIIENIAKSIPANWQLAVKEHLPMIGRRPNGYYKRLSTIPKVRLISPLESGFAIQDKAELTLTITGTAGLEAVLLQKPVVFFGSSPMHILDNGYIIASENENLSDAILKATKQKPASDDELIRFLGALLSQSVDLLADDFWGGDTIVTPKRVQQNQPIANRLAKLIIDDIKEN